ncbi:hypothetical protein [Antarcticibacterium sp. 1MA-6-2]|uniref:hypothetical protein n=1 Tax=Antarcticibacterium sp. 1MA-6-2 TaxID=2908210 RepID=UPI0028833484|nr:hypothetical protein [Antarcticibacterium sp. 1MA-6-2]
MGGVINIITRKPERETTAFAEATFGNYGRKQFMGGIRTPVGDRLFFGAAGMY